MEALRSAIETEATAYALNHYKHGICSVFSTTNGEGQKAIVVCIEDHQFQPKNYWYARPKSSPRPVSHFVFLNCFCRNGRWRSVWSVVISGSQAEVTGVLKVQVHDYEDGNVQLVSSKDVKDSISVSVSSKIDRARFRGFHADFFSERGERGQRLDQADGGLGVRVPAGHLGELHDDVGHHVQGLEEAAPGHENQDRLEQDRELLHRKGAQEPITILAGDLFFTTAMPSL